MTLYDDSFCRKLFQLMQNAAVEPLMYPAPPAQPSTIYRDPPAHSPYSCYRMPVFFGALTVGLGTDGSGPGMHDFVTR